ncbi:uncharacterized protein MYCFIDRAFT_173762 [Pseudocercospora fijiensis CIRAD86]|uniref:DUF7730 domain-containing protein n=1 Tax=Pseudocercospora fijiensis (strain CIRAD86) TaxID=383855 RepID=M3B698_PSEFD|nr:uncharacterized protein MYCFIDRAFT_173762 [Pseudocercospora fijiensis CIRAD86]EME84858.1 hypothetical protein MYCFIDRAFT_173762 [Pseudocercospora fijiensis CIRAD86]
MTTKFELSGPSAPAVTPAYQKLLDDIESFLSPYRHTLSKPDLPLEQLVVVAVCFNPDRAGTCALKWLVSNFRYFQDLVNSDFCGVTLPSSSQNFRKEFFNAIYKLDVPITVKKLKLVVDADEARLFLGLNGRDSTTSFRFMALPPEIRNTIYEMAFTPALSRVHALTKNNIMTFPLLNWFWTPADLPHGQEKQTWEGRTLIQAHFERPRNGSLAIEFQFYAEAMPIFYSTNTFVAHDNGELNDLMKKTPEHRRKHFQQVVFMLHPKDVDIGARIHSIRNLTKDYSGLKALQGIADLRSLDIVMWEEEWMAVRKTTKNQALKYTDILKIPPMPLLEQFRGKSQVNSISEAIPAMIILCFSRTSQRICTLETENGLTKVTFHGNCDNVKAHLQPLMTLPRVQEVEDSGNAKPVKAPKKRKAKRESRRLKTQLFDQNGPVELEDASCAVQACVFRLSLTKVQLYPLIALCRKHEQGPRRAGLAPNFWHDLHPQSLMLNLAFHKLQHDTREKSAGKGAYVALKLGGSYLPFEQLSSERK